MDTGLKKWLFLLFSQNFLRFFMGIHLNSNLPGPALQVSTK